MAGAPSLVFLVRALLCASGEGSAGAPRWRGTKVFHEQALDVSQGPHVLTVVDDRGNRARRFIEVLSKGSASGPASSVN